MLVLTSSSIKRPASRIKYHASSSSFLNQFLENVCRNIKTLFNFDPASHRRGNSSSFVTVRAKIERVHQTIKGK